MHKQIAFIALILCKMSMVWGLTVTDSTIYGSSNTLITWTDQRGKERKAGLVKSGSFAGIFQFFSYYSGSARVLVTNTATSGSAWNAGFCSFVHHGASTTTPSMTVSQKFVGTSRASFEVFANLDGVKESVTYTFFDGLDYFQYGLCENVGSGTKAADSRSPYATIDYSGQGAIAEGLEYGAEKYFKQPVLSYVGGTAWNNWSGAFTFGGTCDIPYAWEWSKGKEIGFVQTQTYSQQNSGVPGWSSVNIPATGAHMGDFWGDPTWAADYQMNFYDCSIKTTWGVPYGWMNASGDALDGSFIKNGWGQYSLSIIFDAKADSGVMRIRDENRIIHTSGVTFAATVGTIKTQGPVGVTNPALQTLSPVGYDHNNRAWWITSSGNRADLTLNITQTARTLVSPILRIANMNALPSQVTLNGSVLSSGTGYYASFDQMNKEVWITLVRAISGNNRIVIDANPTALASLLTHRIAPISGSTVRWFDINGTHQRIVRQGTAKILIAVTPTGKFYAKSPLFKQHHTGEE